MYETERCSRSCGPKRGFPKQQAKAKCSLFLLEHTGSSDGSRSREGEADQQEGRTRPGSGARRRPREAADAGRTHAGNAAGEKRAAKPTWGPQPHTRRTWGERGCRSQHEGCPRRPAQAPCAPAQLILPSASSLKASCSHSHQPPVPLRLPACC